MNAKDVLIDFLNYAFLIAVVVFCVIYFTVGDRFETFSNVLRSLAPLAFFSVLFVFFYKYKMGQRRKGAMNDRNSRDEIVVYLKSIDRTKDIAMIVVISVVNILLSFIMTGFNMDNLIQILVIFIIMALWSWFLLKGDGYNEFISLTLGKIINDEVLIFIYPIIFYTSAYVMGRVPGIVDIFQSLILLLFMYFWHYVLFEKKNLKI